MLLADPRLLAVAVGDGVSVPLVLAFLIGAVAFTRNTATAQSPRPTWSNHADRVLIAKFASITLASAAISTVTAAVAVPPP